MSTAAITTVFPPPPPPVPIPTYITSLGFGYSIAIALGFLLLISTIILSSYICCRASRLRFSASGANGDSSFGFGNRSIIVPRIIFVAEDADLESAVSGNVVVGGLDQPIINSYPKFPYTKGIVVAASGDAFQGGDGEGGDTTCSICLCEYMEEEMLRMMPECRHYFHVSCLDAWLKLNGSCPVCRNSPLPTPQSTPQSTPLSEVVPLSQYAADRRRR
ncbi:RING-H2 finger protein ATL68 [Raphanus sativus]|uniref:RING-H2 finger protein ATL68 n=1 Tax=Raphanus sativus TaxID=3726 RepID=A0A6J0M4F9_RAPSA|nr:RING-H2 finger protein ATL68 [Raphanus sativus]XP_056865980.1 RING-H2 finger protein ATL68-like [Raphanus sativus]KAJ4866289.1 RING-H2 finger protein ATL68 [Raphanus sativus]KAJ4905254.1 RING-H2 finger protein ATL68 [Raphanus sativus]